MTDYEWLCQTVPEHLPWLKESSANDDKLSSEEFTKMWIGWLMKMNFAKSFGNREAYIIARPVNLGWVFDTNVDYFSMLFHFDPDGEVVWIDSLWAPGFYSSVLDFLHWTRKPYVAWEHKGKLYFKVIKTLSGNIPSRLEIAEGFVRAVHS